jgi:GrpB-like predicted nucleotidyltransferase (UPF0157 family)
MKVPIVEYRPQWRKMFEEEKQLLQAVLGEVSVKVEHIGSTSVDGLAAKPVIDIMVGLTDFSLADSLVSRIEALGYEYIKKYEDEMPFRRYFVKNLNGIRTHQIHTFCVIRKLSVSRRQKQKPRTKEFCRKSTATNSAGRK